MKLTEPEIVALIDMHAGSLTDLACEIMSGCGEVSDIHRAVERIRELVALLPQREEARTMQ